MAQVFEFIPQIPRKLICSKGNLHCEQPLNLVCLDPLCRDDPLACSVCFSQIHKYHKVVSLDKLLSDYLRNVRTFSKPNLQKKVSRQHIQIREYVQQFRKSVNRQIDKFQQNIQRYAFYLNQHLEVRKEIQQFTGTKLEPSQIKRIGNYYELNQSVRFILNNSLFDQAKNMVNMSDLLKQDQDKVYALLDKLVNMTEQCQREIMSALSKLSFAGDTIKKQKKKFNQNVKNARNSNADPLNLAQFIRIKKELEKTVKDNSTTFYKTAKSQIVDKTCSSTLKKQPFSRNNNFQLEQSKNKQCRITFSRLITQGYDQNYVDRIEENVGLGATQFQYRFSKYHHQMITIKNKAFCAVSNITALKPQFALISPHINVQPQQVRQWSLKIVNCRNFASANTLGVGIGTLSTIKLANYEQDPTNTMLVTSQGYTILNGKHQKTEFIYGSGDTLHFKYDPFYKTLQIQKKNGRKLTLRALQADNQHLYICVRLTYATDQVQIV